MEGHAPARFASLDRPEPRADDRSVQHCALEPTRRVCFAVNGGINTEGGTVAEPTTVSNPAHPDALSAIRDELAQSKTEVSLLQERIERLETALDNANVHVPPVNESSPQREGSASTEAEAEADTTAESQRRTSRRGLIKAVGAVSAGAAASALVHTQPAAAADPNDVVKNVQNNTSDETEIRATSNIPSGRNVFLAQSTAFSSGSRTAAVAGWAGDNEIYNGVYGYTEGRTTNTNTGHALIANAAFGSRSNILLLTTSLSDPTQSGIAHQRGELIRDTSGNLWLCTSSGTPGTWRKLAGPTSAGSLHLLSSPVRAYDSRPSEGGAGPNGGGGSQTVNLRVAGVPTGFNGALVNLTTVTPSAAGFAVIYANNAVQPSTSSVNFTAGSVVGNNATTRVDSTGFARFFSSATTNYVVDVMGYYQ